MKTLLYTKADLKFMLEELGEEHSSVVTLREMQPNKDAHRINRNSGLRGFVKDEDSSR